MVSGPVAGETTPTVQSDEKVRSLAVKPQTGRSKFKVKFWVVELEFSL